MKTRDEEKETKSREIRKKLRDCAWEKFTVILKYKLEDRNAKLIKVPKSAENIGNIIDFPYLHSYVEEAKELLRNKILLRMRQNIPELQPGQPDITVTVMDEGHPVRRSWWKYGLAAAVAGAILFLLFRPSGEVALPGSAMRQMPESPRLISYSNVTGRLHLLLLPDSSKVWVSPNSSIRYLEKFAAERKVTLQGEAFFEIAKSAGQPFIVSSGDLVTRVMGTSFLLKAYQGKTAEISVVTGKVAVSRKDKMDKQIILTAK